VAPTRIIFGNSAPHEKSVDGESFDPIDIQDASTTVVVPEGVGIADALVAVVDLWPSHSSAPPEWVSSSSQSLADLLGEHFGCPVHPYEED